MAPAGVDVGVDGGCDALGKALHGSKVGSRGTHSGALGACMMHAHGGSPGVTCACSSMCVCSSHTRHMLIHAVREPCILRPAWHPSIQATYERGPSRPRSVPGARMHAPRRWRCLYAMPVRPPHPHGFARLPPPPGMWVGTAWTQQLLRYVHLCTDTPCSASMHCQAKTWGLVLPPLWQHYLHTRRVQRPSLPRAQLPTLASLGLPPPCSSVQCHVDPLPVIALRARPTTARHPD